MILEIKTHTYKYIVPWLWFHYCRLCITFFKSPKFNLSKTTLSPVTASTCHGPVLNKAILL